MTVAAQTFAELFAGNPAAHYVRHKVDGRYEAVKRGLDLADISRHLAGEEPAVLAVPILPTGCCHFGVIDVDRHEDDQAPVDWPALARRVTELKLPLVVCRSRGGRGAWLFLFIKEPAGFSAAAVRQVLMRYAGALDLTDHVDIFPRQDNLRPGQKGNGVNLPYHGDERPAFDVDGDVLDLAGFLTLAQERRVFGQLLVERDLPAAVMPASRPAGGNRPLPARVVRELHRQNLDLLRAAAPGARNTTLNTVAFFAARAITAGVLEQTAEMIKQELMLIARGLGIPEREAEATLRSAWAMGSAQPLVLVDERVAHDEALARITALLADVNLPVLDVEAVVQDAARLAPLEYGPLRRNLAERLHIKAELLDGEVARRQEREADTQPGSEVIIRDVEPWGETVRGATMLDELEALFLRYVFFIRAGDAAMLATWIVYTYAYDIFRVAPYIGITSPEKECGKTTLLEVLTELVRRPLFASNFTPASIFRAVDLYTPTLLIDELDTFLQQSVELNGILNSGHKKKGAYVCRCVGDANELRRFSTWGPKAYGMIGRPTGTLVSRSLVVNLLRKKADEKVDQLPREVPPEFNRLRRQAARWTQDRAEDLARCRPDLTGLTNRAADNWEPLFAVAEVAGERWPRRVREVSVAHVREHADDDVRIQLLRDVRNIFHSRQASFIPAELMVRDLLRQAESPWQRYDRGQELNRHHLRQLLADLGVSSRQDRVAGELLPYIRDPGKPVQRGYRLAQFQDIFERFLKDEMPEAVETGPGENIII